MPAAAARFKHNCTVEREQPIAAAIFLSLTPAALSRSTSRILRTGNLFCATDDLLQQRKRDHGSRGLPASHYGPTCSGIMDRHGSERWTDINRNTGPTWSGTGGRHGPEYAASGLWNDLAVKIDQERSSNRYRNFGFVVFGSVILFAGSFWLAFKAL
jgi:hypothetical protein